MASVVEILFKAKDFVSKKLDQLSTKVSRFGSDSSQSAEGVDKLSKSTSSLTSKVLAFIAGSASIATVSSLFSKVVNVGAGFESLKTQLDAVTGSSERGEQALAWIQRFTKRTPLQLEQVTEGFVKLKSFGIDPMDGAYQAIVDQSSKLGGGQERLNGIILAVGQAWTKQKLQAEEANQLIERGVPVYDLLSKSLGKTTAEIQEMASKGELGRDAITSLITAMGDDAVGAAAEQMDDYSGIISNLKDQFTEFFKEISDNGVLEYVKDQFKALSQTIQTMRDDGSLQKLAKGIADTMIGTAEVVKSTVATIVSFSRELKNLALAFVAVKTATFVAGMVTVISTLTRAKTAQIALNAAIRANPIGLLTGLVAGLFTAIQALVDKYADWRNKAEDQAQAEFLAAQAAEEARKKYEELSDIAQIQIQNEADLTAAVESGIIALNSKTQQYERIKTEAELAALAENNYRSALEGVTDDIEQQAQELAASTQASQAFKTKVDEMTESTEGFADRLSSLSSQEFAQFRAEAENALSGKFLTDAEKATIKIDLVAEALRRAGVDAELFKSGLSSAGLEVVRNLEFLVDESELAGEALLSAVGGAIDKISTQTGLDRVTASLAKIANQGRLTKDQIALALEKIDAKAESLLEPLNQVNDLLANLGSSIGSADTVERLEELRIAATDALSAGLITADEYNDVITAIDSRLESINEKLTKQKRLQRELNKEGADSGTENQLKAENKQRSIALNWTQRQIESYQKARDLLRDGAYAVIRGVPAYRKYLATVSDIARQYELASENADRLAGNALKAAANGDVSTEKLQQYIRSLEAAINWSDRLDSQSLSNLQNALSAAKSKLSDLSSEARSAISELSGLESELASLNGDQLRVQQLANEQKRLELESKIAEAKADGNTEAVKSYQKALTLLSQINKKKIEQIKADQQAQKQRDTAQTVKEKQTEKSSGDRSETVVVKIRPSNGKAVDATVKKGDEAALLDILKQGQTVTR